jgi:hypothetical protein
MKCGFRFCLFVGFWLATATFSLTAQEQASPDAASSPAQSTSEESSPDDAVPELPPAQPPQVSYVGGTLSIDANGSTLADVLKLVEEKTGAHVEMPASAGKERVVAHLGPGVAREVLGDLLYGLPFNYVIEGSENDSAELQSLLLTERKVVSASVAASNARPAGSNPRPSSFAHNVAPPEPEAANSYIPPEQAQAPDVPSSAEGALDPASLWPPPTGNHNDNRQVSAVATQAVLDSQQAQADATPQNNNAPARPIDQMSNTLNRLYQVRQQIQERQNQQDQRVK